MPREACHRKPTLCSRLVLHSFMFISLSGGRGGYSCERNILWALPESHALCMRIIFTRKVHPTPRKPFWVMLNEHGRRAGLPEGISHANITCSHLGFSFCFTSIDCPFQPHRASRPLSPSSPGGGGRAGCRNISCNMWHRCTGDAMVS